MKFLVRNILPVALVAVIALAGTCGAADKPLEELIADRSARLYLEGQALGDMVLGARARLDFIYIDRTLAETARENDVPEWLEWNTSYFGSRKSGEGALFLLVFETFKPWTFEPEMIRVNGKPIEKGDIVTRSEYVPRGDLPSDYTGRFVFTVVPESVGPGKEIVFSCRDDSVTWMVPEK